MFLNAMRSVPSDRASGVPWRFDEASLGVKTQLGLVESSSPARLLFLTRLRHTQSAVSTTGSNERRAMIRISERLIQGLRRPEIGRESRDQQSLIEQLLARSPPQVCLTQMIIEACSSCCTAACSLAQGCPRFYEATGCARRGAHQAKSTGQSRSTGAFAELHSLAMRSLVARTQRAHPRHSACSIAPTLAHPPHHRSCLSSNPRRRPSWRRANAARAPTPRSAATR